MKNVSNSKIVKICGLNVCVPNRSISNIYFVFNSNSQALLEGNKNVIKLSLQLIQPFNKHHVTFFPNKQVKEKVKYN